VRYLEFGGGKRVTLAEGARVESSERGRIFDGSNLEQSLFHQAVFPLQDIASPLRNGRLVPCLTPAMGKHRC
jgi:hypothetical protein